MDEPPDPKIYRVWPGMIVHLLLDDGFIRCRVEQVDTDYGNLGRVWMTRLDSEELIPVSGFAFEIMGYLPNDEPIP